MSSMSSVRCCGKEEMGLEEEADGVGLERMVCVEGMSSGSSVAVDPVAGWAGLLALSSIGLLTAGCGDGSRLLRRNRLPLVLPVEPGPAPFVTDATEALETLVDSGSESGCVGDGAVSSSTALPFSFFTVVVVVDDGSFFPPNRPDKNLGAIEKTRDWRGSGDETWVERFQLRLRKDGLGTRRKSRAETGQHKDLLR